MSSNLTENQNPLIRKNLEFKCDTNIRLFKMTFPIIFSSAIVVGKFAYSHNRHSLYLSLLVLNLKTNAANDWKC